jgi:type II secretory pathway pseudopilin PulG
MMIAMNRLRDRVAFTLVELMFSMAIVSLLVVGLLHGYVTYTRGYRIRSDLSTVQQNVRKAVDMISRDLRHAGYGIPAPYNNLSQWVTWVAGVTNPVMVVKGAGPSDPDRLIITGALDAPVSSLRLASAPGDIVLNLETGDGSLFNNADRKMVVIGRVETARVTGITQNSISVSKDPVAFGVGLSHGYPAGTPIELVTVTTYTMVPAPEGFPGVPYLQRIENSDTPPSDVASGIAALHIDDFGVTRLDNQNIQVWVQGRTPHPDQSFSHPVFGDPYRRIQLRSGLFVRNLQ